MPPVAVFLAAALAAAVRANLYQECAKYFHPYNYVGQAPSLHLPYVGDVPIPFNVPKIRPSAATKTKAINVVTKYVYRNPVCVKYTKRKAACKPESDKNKNDMEQLVTKEYFVRDRANRLGENERRRTSEENFKGKEGEGVRKHRSQTFDDYYDDNAGEDFHDVNIYLQSTEDIRPYVKDNRRTPTLSKKQIHEMLIEDRLDQLETVLPHYTRRRVFETSTITITKVISNRRAMATLTVKNCVPQGYEFCSNKIKRKSKMAQSANNSNESHYFG